ncbi:Uncharacterised protein [Mycobacteroides abscessus subsp. abscessus]|nr:Uncharacterised protein [Mycobacteroides abscessus subsp. abscessus]
MKPREGSDLDVRTSVTSSSTCSRSPGRVGVGQVRSMDAPMMPVANGSPVVTSSRMVIDAVCHPLAASPRKKVSCAVSSPRWKGWGSHAVAKSMIASVVRS